MTRLDETIRMPRGVLTGPEVQQLSDLLREHAIAINGMYGRLQISYGTSAPTTGSHTTSEYVANTIFSERGSYGSKYIVRGWACVETGAPGTWVEDRGLTGN